MNSIHGRWTMLMLELPGEVMLNGGVDLHRAGYSAGAVDAIDLLCNRLQQDSRETPSHVLEMIQEVLVEAARLRNSQVKGIRPKPKNT